MHPNGTYVLPRFQYYKRVINWILDQPDVYDANKIFIYGFSQNGFFGGRDCTGLTAENISFLGNFSFQERPLHASTRKLLEPGLEGEQDFLPMKHVKLPV